MREEEEEEGSRKEEEEMHITLIQKVQLFYLGREIWRHRRNPPLRVQKSGCVQCAIFNRRLSPRLSRTF